MARPKVDDPHARRLEILDGLIVVFKRHGYDGASLADLAEATGIAKASLYHRYPGGKPELGRAALTEAGRRFTVLILKPLQGDQPPAERLSAMLAGVARFHAGGTPASLMNTLTLGDGLALFGKDIRNTITAWQRLIARALEELGRPADAARLEAEDAIARIEGALVLARLSDDADNFPQALARLAATLGVPAP